VTFFAMLGVTAMLTLIQTRQPSYHGVFWRQLNPNLPQWWEAKHAPPPATGSGDNQENPD